MVFDMNIVIQIIAVTNDCRFEHQDDGHVQTTTILSSNFFFVFRNLLKVSK